MSEDIQNLPLRTLEYRISQLETDKKNLLVRINNQQHSLDKDRVEYKKVCEKIEAYQMALRVLIHGSIPVSAIVEPKMGEKDE